MKRKDFGHDNDLVSSSTYRHILIGYIKGRMSIDIVRGISTSREAIIRDFIREFGIMDDEDFRIQNEIACYQVAYNRSQRLLLKLLNRNKEIKKNENR